MSKQGLSAVPRALLNGAAGLLFFIFAWPGAALAQQADLLPAAREAARTDRNTEAARLFGEFLRRHPQSRREILREYADQLIYSGRPERALPLLREVLSWDLEQDERRRAQKSEALALLWSNQNRRAAAAYDAIVAQDPGDADALLNRARALQWLGRPDRALAALDALPSSSRGSSGAEEIAREINRAARPLSGATARHVDQVDGLEISTFRIEQTLFARSGAAQLRPYYERRLFDQRGAGELTTQTPGMTSSVRVSDAFELGAQFGLEFQRGFGIERTEPVYELAAAFLPSDSYRFDLVTARRTLDNFKSLQLGITSQHYFASADFWPDPMLKLTLRTELTDYSDGNVRRWAQAEAERRVSREPNIFVGVRASAFEFDERLDNGYFNPDSFKALELTARGWSSIGRATWIDLAASAGPEHSDPGGTKLAYWLRGKLTRALSDRLEASIAAERLSSRGLTNSGFARTSISASLGFRW